MLDHNILIKYMNRITELAIPRVIYALCHDCLAQYPGIIEIPLGGISRSDIDLTSKATKVRL